MTEIVRTCTSCAKLTAGGHTSETLKLAWHLPIQGRYVHRAVMEEVPMTEVVTQPVTQDTSFEPAAFFASDEFCSSTFTLSLTNTVATVAK
jgi:hypothetical protein